MSNALKMCLLRKRSRRSAKIRSRRQLSLVTGRDTLSSGTQLQSPRKPRSLRVCFWLYQRFAYFTLIIILTTIFAHLLSSTQSHHSVAIFYCSGLALPFLYFTFTCLYLFSFTLSFFNIFRCGGRKLFS